MRRSTGDPPGAARADDPLLVADPERHLTLDHEAALLIRVTMLRDDRARHQLHDRQRQALALDAPTDDAVPDLDRNEVGEIDEVGHSLPPGGPARSSRMRVVRETVSAGPFRSCRPPSPAQPHERVRGMPATS